MNKYLFVAVILIFTSCLGHKAGVNKSSSPLQQIQEGLEYIPPRRIDTTELEKQLHKVSMKARNMIAYQTIDFVLNSDTVIFIEVKCNNVIGGHPDYYVYASNHQQVKYFKSLNERKTYTIDELEATLHASLPPELYPPHWTKAIIEELKKGTPFPMRDIIFSIQTNSLDSCIVEIGKLCYTPSSTYDIVIAKKTNENYSFQYFFARMCMRE
jgi:hypothetical protein